MLTHYGAAGTYRAAADRYLLRLTSLTKADPDDIIRLLQPCFEYLAGTRGDTQPQPSRQGMWRMPPDDRSGKAGSLNSDLQQPVQRPPAGAEMVPE